ncbi:inhibitor of apoptosis (iap) domain family member [Echinococcus granulosus]|nr:inhibitor of apoptosis (iap) domain family member [Echinococcus granulosus]EUB59801.1 inhibitor of apoptosis (iap) domain family member [Echinococcus granulosus]
MEVTNWDPLTINGDCALMPSAQTRIKTDLRKFYQDPPEGIVVTPCSENLGKVYAVINGPADTPYEGGFFIFLIAFPTDYPLSPPKVRIINTGGGTVRFGPNLYASGKVCLSIIGTWSGPQWSPIQNLTSVLLSIQSLLNAEPYYNEPGYEQTSNPRASAHYNEMIKHETLRCAVCDVMERKASFPDDLFEIMKITFLEQYDDYLQACKDGAAKDKMPMRDPFSNSGGTFQFNAIRSRLEALKAKF